MISYIKLVTNCIKKDLVKAYILFDKIRIIFNKSNFQKQLKISYNTFVTKMSAKTDAFYIIRNKLLIVYKVLCLQFYLVRVIILNIKT